MRTGIAGMLERTATFAARQRRESRSEEWREHIRHTERPVRHLDPACTFWTSLENKPISAVTGMFQKMRGVRSGLPDVMVIHRCVADLAAIFVELKSRRGKASKAQMKLREDIRAVEVKRCMARGARAAMVAVGQPARHQRRFGLDV
jgi:hypothetical protein